MGGALDEKTLWELVSDVVTTPKAIKCLSCQIDTVQLIDDNGCLDTAEFHAEGKGGVTGYLKIHHGTTPSAHKEADNSIFWVNSEGRLFLEQPDGTDLEVLLNRLIDIDDVEAFLVRKADDAGDVFIVDTVNGFIGIGGIPDEWLHIFGNNAAIKLEDDSENYARIKVGNSQLTLEVDPDNVVASTDIVFKMDGSEVARFALYNNFGFRTTGFGDGRGVFAIKNASVIPSTNPVDAGIIYTEAGALKYRGSSGTVTILANA